MKILLFIFLIFIIILSTLSNSYIENFEQSIQEKPIEEKPIKESIKKENTIEKNDHPAIETSIDIKKMIVNINPASVDDKMNVIQPQKQFLPLQNPPKTVPSKGYGAYTTLGTGPFETENRDILPKDDIMTGFLLNHPRYRHKASFLGATDHAKVSPKYVKENIFNDDCTDCYTYMNKDFISFPQERYSVTELQQRHAIE